ncbi:hypothetical protein, partial [Aquitalea sp. LB_tupeE]|uniref:hypothetical protein n=1 Tax=Aquitalea sp. LB_tupeE TaxID=2748078 RepID=UPI001C4B7450
LIQATMDEVLSPMKASALYVGMQYRAPLAFYSAMGLDEASLDAMRSRFAANLLATLGSQHAA